MAQRFDASFVGRTAELDDLLGLVGTRHLATVVGEGGVGKTRLARELADTLAASWPVFWVDLGTAIGAASVRASFEDSLRPASGRASFEDLIEERIPVDRCLIVIDNCEHVLDDVVARIGLIGSLRPEARIIATSRTRLGVNGEVVYRLQPLPVPPSDTTLVGAPDVPSVELLVDRLCDSVADFDLTPDNVDDVVVIADRTEGVPLAIELVAAAAGTLPLAEIARGIPDLRELGVADARREPRRHRSLDASVRWSVDRLGSQAGVAFRRLGAFVDSFCFASAVRVISESGDRDDHDATRSFVELVEASLVRRLGDDRYSLPMAVRTFAQDELVSDPDVASIRDRHAEVVHDLVAEAATALREGSDADESWLRLLDLELPEIRAAVDWRLYRRRPDLAAHLLLETYHHAHMRGRYGELTAQCRTVLADPDLDRTDGSRISTAAAMASLMSGRVADGHEFATRALADSDDPVAQGHARIQRAWTGFYSGRLDGATVWADLDEGLRIGAHHRDPELHTVALVRSGSLTVQARSISEGRRILAAAASSDRLPAHHWLAARLFSVYGTTVFDLRFDERRREVLEVVDDCRSAGHVAFQTMALATAGTIDALRGDVGRADGYLDQAQQLAQQHDLATFENVAQRWRSFAHYRFGRPDVLEQAWRAVELAEATGNAWDAAAGHWLVGLVLLRSDDAGADAHLRTAVDLSIEPGYPFSRIRGELALGLVDLRDDAFTSGLGRVHDALKRADEYGDLLGVAGALDHLARFECERSAFDRAARFAGAADAIHGRWGVERLPCERDLRAIVDRRLVEHAGAEDARRIVEEGRSLDRVAVVRLARRSRGRRGRPVSGWSSLTPTEHEVADLAADGLTNQTIAERLVMSSNTVKTHLSHVYAKLGVTGRSGLAAERARQSNGS